MPDPIRIEKQETAAGGRYVARIDGVEGEAQLLFTRRAPGAISADHTEAPDSMRGRGVALALVEHMIADARAESFKVIPVCPYVQAQTKKHPQWADVIVASAGA